MGRRVNLLAGENDPDDHGETELLHKGRKEDCLEPRFSEVPLVLPSPIVKVNGKLHSNQKTGAGRRGKNNEDSDTLAIKCQSFHHIKNPQQLKF